MGFEKDFHFEGTAIPTVTLDELDPGQKYKVELLVELDYFNATFADITSVDLNETIRALVEPVSFVQTEDVDIDLLLLVDTSDAVDDRASIVRQGKIKGLSQN